MLFQRLKVISLLTLGAIGTALGRPQQTLLADFQVSHVTENVTTELFSDLEELSRIVDIAYCVGATGLGIQKPFLCASRCQDFHHFELIKTWNTGPLLSDSCGYVTLSHPPSAPRIIVAFRGTYSIANTIIDLSTVPQQYVPYPAHDSDEQEENGSGGWRDLFARSVNTESSKCDGCMVHAGFMTSWRHTRPQLMDTVEDLVNRYPDYQLTLVGHSLGGAVAALASLDFHAKRWNPQVTTFGEPRIGNKALMKYIDKAFCNESSSNTSTLYRRVTHIDDPVPLLPLNEWGYRMHAGEVYIFKSDLPPENDDLRLCKGDEDPRCIAGAEVSRSFEVPARFRIWQFFFAHRDYFWRLGLCIPGGTPKG
ncbi:MAG: hypothetical protein Q9216_000930 [Gyalolechia sp. 2 TL-2023]